MNANETLAQILRNIDRDIEAEERLHGIYTGVRRYVAQRNGKRCDRRDIPALDAASTGDRAWTKNPGRDTMLVVRFKSREETTWNRSREREETSWNEPEHSISLHAGPPGQGAKFDLDWFDRENAYAAGAMERADRLRACYSEVSTVLRTIEAAIEAINTAAAYTSALHEGGRHVGEVVNGAIVRAINQIPGIYIRD